MAEDRQDTGAPVWIWLPGREADHANADSANAVAPTPVKAGTFKIDYIGSRPLGHFIYDRAYLDRPDAIALDPVSLPLTRSPKGARETKQHGLFGVFRDASPEGYGLSILGQIYGANLSDPIERLCKSTGDAVGALEICHDIESRVTYRPPQIERLLDALASIDDRPSSHAVRKVFQAATTSLGGERPKMTVLHKGQMWIAKLQDRGDLPHMPLREFVHMRLAAQCGINVPEVEFIQQGHHQVFLVRRFDRLIDESGHVHKSPFASAHTVLRLEGHHVRGDAQRSYLSFGQNIRRWIASGKTNPDLTPAFAAEQLRELWRRIAFNAVCQNVDDHPRNHGLLFRNGAWQLAPAYDIAPTFGQDKQTVSHAMAITRDGAHTATLANLIACGKSLGYESDEAVTYLQDVLRVFQERFDEELISCGHQPGTITPAHPDWCYDLVSEARQQVHLPAPRG